MTSVSRSAEIRDLSDRHQAGERAERSVVGQPTPSQLRESKLRPIVPRHGAVQRHALLDRLSLSQVPVTMVVAPAGYGKTTLLAQWAGVSPVPVAWLSADEYDNDPAVLCTYLAVALDRLEPLAPGVLTTLAPGVAASTRLPGLLAVLDGLVGPALLVIDQLESVTNPECLDLLGKVATGLPDGIRLVLASRVQPRIPTSRLRVQGRMMEIGVSDLALDLDEATALLSGAGVDPDGIDTLDLVDRTEGWPAGLYLAALAMQVGDRGPVAAIALSGETRLLGEYLRAEVLDQLSPDDAAFLLRTSILDSMNGALCDAMLQATGSARRLETIEDQNMLVVPLDDRREWLRYHRLFGELLRSELHRRDPDLVPQLHARASDWYRANGRPEQAIRHALAARDADRVAPLVLDLLHPMWANGRALTLLGWLDWLAREDLLDRFPEITVHGGLLFAQLGYSAKTEVWSAAAERSPVRSELGDGSSVESLLAYLRAFLGRDGVAAMRSDSILSYDGLGPTSPYRASMLFTEGLSYLIEGDWERAEPLLIRSVDAALAIDAVPFAALIWAVLGSMAGDRQDWTEAAEYADRAALLLEDGAFDGYWSSAFVFASGAVTAIHARRIDDARALLAAAARLRPLLTYALPVVSTLTLLEMARAYNALADPSGAMAVLRQARGILQQRPSLGLLGQQVEALSAQIDASASMFTGGSSLSAAELRLAPYLGTHLTLQEIGERLYIARSTVKSQAISIYRKLGVSSRHEAVDKLQELGLIAI